MVLDRAADQTRDKKLCTYNDGYIDYGSNLPQFGLARFFRGARIENLCALVTYVTDTTVLVNYFLQLKVVRSA
jgi:hypothetical protein